MRGISGETAVIVLVAGIAIAGLVAAEPQLNGGGGFSDGGVSSSEFNDSIPLERPEGYDEFGTGMDVNGSVAGERVVVESKDNATIYRWNRSSQSWDLERIFTSFSPVEPDDKSLGYYDQFKGDSVTIDHDEATGENTLAFRVYDRYGDGVAVYRQNEPLNSIYDDWKHVDTVVPDSGYAVGSVAIDEDTLVVGVPDGAGGDGLVAVYTIGDDSVDHQFSVVEDTDDSEALGWDVAIEETTVLAGDPTGTWSQGRPSSNNESYVLVINTVTEDVTAVLDPETGQLGHSVSLSPADDTLALLGAPATNEEEADGREGSAWRCDTVDLTCERYLGPGSNDGDGTNDPKAFGASVQIWDGSMTIGAPETEVDGTEGAGAVYVYDDGALTQTFEQGGIYFSSESPEQNDYFGASLAYNGDAMWAGASGEDSGAGGAWMWD